MFQMFSLDDNGSFFRRLVLVFDNEANVIEAYEAGSYRPKICAFLWEKGVKELPRAHMDEYYYGEITKELKSKGISILKQSR
jgi:hypothetical protein